jgi:hypothetical protein
MLRSTSDKNWEKDKKSPVLPEVKGRQAITSKSFFRQFKRNIPSWMKITYKHKGRG